MQDLISSRDNSIRRGRHARKMAYNTSNPFNGDLDQPRCIHPPDHGASSLNLSSRTSQSHISESYRVGSRGRHRRYSWTIGSPRVHSPSSDSTATTVPIPRVIYSEANSDSLGLSRDSQIVGLEALLAISTVTHDICETVDRASPTESLRRSRDYTFHPVATTLVPDNRHEASITANPTSRYLRHFKPGHIEVEIRKAISYEKRLAVKGVLAIAFVILLLAARIHFS